MLKDELLKTTHGIIPLKLSSLPIHQQLMTENSNKIYLIFAAYTLVDMLYAYELYVVADWLDKSLLFLQLPINERFIEVAIKYP